MAPRMRLCSPNRKLKKSACKNGQRGTADQGQWRCDCNQGQLAKMLPLQLLDPQSTDIIDHGAKPRRQLLTG